MQNSSHKPHTNNNNDTLRNEIGWVGGEQTGESKGNYGEEGKREEGGGEELKGSEEDRQT